MDVGILIQELDESMAAVEAASDCPGDAFDSGVVTTQIFDLLVDILKDESDGPDDS